MRVIITGNYRLSQSYTTTTTTVPQSVLIRTLDRIQPSSLHCCTSPSVSF
ncbi:hypothetical protein HanIR_Chr17g0860451 [Helianthus annuus]|nr:hypothetical protein HanIR_Chr17g0860451 [Helianthus annuus]